MWLASVPSQRTGGKQRARVALCYEGIGNAPRRRGPEAVLIIEAKFCRRESSFDHFAETAKCIDRVSTRSFFKRQVHKGIRTRYDLFDSSDTHS